MSWTSSAARRARAGSRPLGLRRERSRRSRLKATSAAPAAVAARSRNQAAAERQAEVEDLGAAAAAGPFRLVGDLAGRAFDAGRLLLLERLAGRVFGVLAGVLGASSAGASRAPRRSRRRAPPRRSARPRRGARAAARSSSSRARSRSPAARRAAAAISSRGSPSPARELGLDRLGRERRELDRLAARGDRLQQRRRLGAEQDQVDELGRLLERLQQRVLALVAHRLGGLDDEDPLAALERAVGGGADHPLADLLDHVLGAARRQPDEVGVGRGVEQGAAAGIVGVVGRGGEDLRREGAGRGPLAGPARAAEEVGVGRARPRARALSATRARGWCSVAAIESTRCSRSRRSTVRTASITRSCTSSTVPAPSIDHDPVGGDLGDLLVGLGDGALQLEPLGLEAVLALGAARARARGRPAAAGSGRARGRRWRRR